MLWSAVEIKMARKRLSIWITEFKNDLPVSVNLLVEVSRRERAASSLAGCPSESNADAITDEPGRDFRPGRPGASGNRWRLSVRGPGERGRGRASPQHHP